MAMSNPIPAPPNRQPTNGLLAVADRPNVGDDRWTGGYGFNPEACATGQAQPLDCAPGEEKEIPDNPAAVENEPFIVIGGDRCTTMVQDRDREPRATRHLAAVESSVVEAVLWNGTTGDPQVDINVPRQHLASEEAEVLGSGAVLLDHAMGIMDQALTACLHGVQGMVHVTPRTLVALVAGHLVFRENGRWLTPNGHLVVAGSGYPGTGPRPAADQPLPAAPDLTGASAVDHWMYGTGMVSVLLSSPETLTDTDHRLNTTTTMRERAAAAYFACCHYAVEILYTA